MESVDVPTHPPFTSLLPLHLSLHHILLPTSTPPSLPSFSSTASPLPSCFFSLPSLATPASPSPSFSISCMLLFPLFLAPPFTSSHFSSLSFLLAIFNSFVSLSLLSPPSLSQLAVYSQSVILERRSQVPGRRSTPPPSPSTRT